MKPLKRLLKFGNIGKQVANYKSDFQKLVLYF